jgi:hypothetical protein
MAAVLGSVLLGGCGDDREPMWIDLDMVLRQTRTFEHELRAHGAQVRTMADGAARTAAERRFSDTARRQTDTIAGLMANMQRLCARVDGTPPVLEPAAGALDDLGRELTVHTSAMTLSRTSFAAHAEEDRYQVVAIDWLAAFAAELDRIADGAAAYLCELHN